jgi:hypothetical protein
MAKVDEMNCKKKNAHDYDVNLKEIRDNPKYVLPPTLLDFNKYVQCDLQKFPFWQCVDQAVVACKGWVFLPPDVIMKKYQTLG